MTYKRRRQHTKSRSGCRRCKIRRVKCDEVHPCCGNCARLELCCDYASPKPTPPQQGSKVPIPAAGVIMKRMSKNHDDENKPAITSPSTLPLMWQGQDSRERLLELRLFHNYTHHIAAVVGSGFMVAEILTGTIPALAFQSPTLMDALLALSASHLRQEEPNNQLLVQAHNKYMSRSIKQQLNEISAGISRANFEPVYTTCLLTAANIIFNRQFIPSAEDRYKTLAEWVYSFRGMRAITTSFSSLYHQSNVAPKLPPGGWQNPRMGKLDVSSSEPPIFSFLLDGLEDENPTGEKRKAYEHAVAYLSYLYQNPSRPIHTRFYCEAHSAFITCIEQREPRACMILGVYFKLGALLKEIWTINAAMEQELSIIIPKLPLKYFMLLQVALLKITEKLCAGYTPPATEIGCAVF